LEGFRYLDLRWHLKLPASLQVVSSRFSPKWLGFERKSLKSEACSFRVVRMPKIEMDREDGGRVIVSLSDRDVSDAIRLMDLMRSAQARPTERCSSKAAAGGKIDGCLPLARTIFLSRRLRQQYFPKAIFGEAAWDILLALFTNVDSGGTETVTSLAHHVECPLSTALRWLDYLEQSGLIARNPHPTDKRVMVVSLTNQAREKLTSLFEALVAIE
jgi:DNA-binding MarR family transcriptional regulator